MPKLKNDDTWVKSFMLWMGVATQLHIEFQYGVNQGQKIKRFDASERKNPVGFPSEKTYVKKHCICVPRPTFLHFLCLPKNTFKQ